MTLEKIVISLLPFLLFFSLITACSKATEYRITVENRRDGTIDEFALIVNGEAISLGTLPPGARTEKVLTLPGNVQINYQFKTGEQCHSGVLEKELPPGKRQDKALVVEKDGTITVVDKIHHTETKVPTGKSPDEWALPCMIPG